jgi:tetratricopeptide (TPR) repeat protein
MIADAVVISPRKELVKVAAEYLKIKGVSNVTIPDEGDRTDAIDRFPKALLIIDWDLGAEEVARVLGHNRRKFPGQLRTIMLVAGQVSEQLVATAAEYSVTQIYTEAINPKNLGGRLASLLIGESMPSELKKGIADIAEARNAGDHKNAFGHAKKLLEKHPTNLRVKCETAECLMNLDEWDKALKLLTGIDKGKPPYLRGIHLLGRCLMKLGRFAEAVQSLETANLFNPHDVERLVDIGNALMQMDRIKEANATLDAAIAIDPDFRPAKLGKGQAQLLDGKVNDALTLLREVSGEVEMASIFNTSAVMSMRQGRHEAGMQLYQAAVKALGRDEKVQARLYFNMGIGFRRWQKPEKALGCFEMALKLDPGFQKAREQALLVSQLPQGEAKPQAAPAALPKVSGDSGRGLDIASFEPGLSRVLDDDDLEENLFDD